MNKKIILTIFITLILLLSCSSKPEYAESDLIPNIELTQTKYGYSILPENPVVNKGLIFYPGGLVEHEAYLPFLSKIAEKSNIRVFLVKMPLNFAFLKPNAAEEVINQYKDIDNWYISGHSLGGVMASSFVYKNQDLFEGLILLASYPQEKESLFKTNIKVLSIKGSLDGLVTLEDFTNSKKLLPADSIFKIINGGNHAYFGSYGEQKGDNKASISRDEQQDTATRFIYEFLN